MSTDIKRIRKRRSKPCSICGRWFTPNPRVGYRQRTCLRPECRKKQRRKRQEKFATRNPEYWVERRLREQAERLETGGSTAILRGPPAEMRRMPTEFAQTAIGSQGVVIMGFLGRMLHCACQTLIQTQHHEIKEELATMRDDLAQTAIPDPGPAP